MNKNVDILIVIDRSVSMQFAFVFVLFFESKKRIDGWILFSQLLSNKASKQMQADGRSSDFVRFTNVVP